ncbi:MAG: alpha/beta hydrolase [Rhodocyclales bacterium]|nr:alpha/beta hydrolase [Rhodocyclales bacterium]
MNLTINGMACHIATAGPAPAPAVPKLLLVHGAANDHAAWHDVLPALAQRGISAFAPDLPGHGRSAGAPLDSVEALADWLLALIGKLELDGATVAGHSMGSLVALEAAARGGRRIGKLALLGTAIPMPVSAALLDAARTTPDAACRMVTLWSHTPAFFLGGGGGHGVWGPGKTLAVMRRNSRTLATDLANCNDYGNGMVAAAAVDCPTLLLLGRRDRMTPLRTVQPLQEALRHATRRELADCGHAMMVEQPAAVAAALADFAA